MELTILTPSFNREKSLCNLYHSLQKQTTKAFEWFIVDDGSTDNTRQFVDSLDADFPIRYVYKENGGKHTALNLGIRNIQTELTFIVDSDDTLTEDAVETVLRYHSKYAGAADICGYVFLRKFPDGKINGAPFRTDELIGSYLDVRINSNDYLADKAEVFLTSCLREFPFPEYPGERFLGEDIVWMRMSRRYRMVHINQAIYVGDYQGDGLTRNRRAHNIHAPLGCMNRAKEFMEKDVTAKLRVRGALQSIVYGRFAGCSIPELVQNTKHKGLVIPLLPAGLALYADWKRKYQ